MNIRKKKEKQALTIFIGLLFIGLSHVYAYEEVRELNNFREVGFSIPGELEVEQGNKYYVKITGDESDVNDIITQIEGDKLIIKSRSKNAHYKGIKVFVILPEIESIDVAGSGNAIIPKQVKADNIKFNLAGSGDISAEKISALNVNVNIAGSGNIRIEGKTESLTKIEIAGSGNVYLENLESEDVEIHIAGSGSAQVFAMENLDVHIAGSGDVYYKGSPRVNSKIAGSGKTRKL